MSAPAVPLSTAAGDAHVPDSAEQWAAWLAKGKAHDRAFRRKLSYAAPIVVVALSLVFFSWLAR